MKSAQGTIKFLMKSDFSSDLTHFLTIIGGRAQPIMGGRPKVGGGAQAFPNRYKVRPLG